MKAKEWLLRGNQELDPVDSFTNYWRGFNNLFFNVLQGQERDKIRAFIAQRISEVDSEKLLSINLKEVTYLMSKPVIDMRGNGKDTSLNIQLFNTETTFVSKLQEVFMVIYQIRCNLEHGQKSPNLERDVELCRSAAPFVVGLLNLVLIQQPFDSGEAAN